MKRNSRPSGPCLMQDNMGNSAPMDYDPLVYKFLSLFPDVARSTTEPEIVVNLWELSKSEHWKLLNDPNLTQYIKTRG